MANINDLTLAKGLTAKVEEVCLGLEAGEAPRRPGGADDGVSPPSRQRRSCRRVT